MSESARNIVKYIVITVEFVFAIYEEGSGNGVWCEVLHSCTEKSAVVSGQMFKNDVRLWVTHHCALIFSEVQWAD